MAYDHVKFQIGIGVTILLIAIAIIIVVAINLVKTEEIQSDETNGTFNINGQKLVLSWSQTTDEQQMSINKNVTRAVIVPCTEITNQQTDAFSLDKETGIVTYNALPDLSVNMNYRITLQLPSSDSKEIQHFMSKNANDSWNLINPVPDIIMASNQSPLVTTVNDFNQNTITTLTLITTLKLKRNDTFGLCTNQQNTNNSTIYKNVACQLFV